MQELNKELIFDETFVPIPGSPSNFILGPCFKTMFPPELSSFYTLAEGEKLLLHSIQPDWFKGKYLCSWPSHSRSWIDWVDRVEKAKGDIKRLLTMPSQVMLLPENCSALSAAQSIHAGAPDLSAERALALEKLIENLPHFSSTLRRAKKDQEEYYKKVAKKVLLIDELTKYQEFYTNLKGSNDKLEYQISKLEAILKNAKTKREAIQEQPKKCYGKFNALDELEAEFPVLNEMKELADWDVARLEESLRDFKSKIIE